LLLFSHSAYDIIDMMSFYYQQKGGLRMPILNLTPDELLSTTRSVRKRLDLTRPVEPELIRECLELALQAPTGSNTQNWQFVVVTDPEKRKAISELYRQSWTAYRSSPQRAARTYTDPTERRQTMKRVVDSSEYLAEHLHEVPVHVIPCITGRLDKLSTTVLQAGAWGSILPAVWSFMLAARSRGLGTSWTTLHLAYEREAADVLGIPYDKVTQCALIPVAYTLGTNFSPAPREPLDSVLHWDKW
jgi:nitroreductase